MIVVSNATPLIPLAKIGQFHLLGKLFAELTISTEVWHEVVVRGAGRAGSDETAQAGWIQVVSLANPDLLPTWQSTYNLGAGEISTVLLGNELSAGLVLIDERRARRLAADQGLALSGSIALLENAYRKNLVSDLCQIYLDLLAAKIWIDRGLLNRSLESVGLPHI